MARTEVFGYDEVHLENRSVACKYPWIVLTFSTEKVRTVFPRERNALRKLAHELNDLSNVVIVLAVPGARSRVEQIVPSRQKLKDL